MNKTPDDINKELTSIHLLETDILDIPNEVPLAAGGNTSGPKDLPPFDPDRIPTKEELRQQVINFIHHLETQQYPKDVIRRKANILREELELYEDIEDEIDAEIHETDLGNALRLVKLHSENIRYCHPWHKWLVWDTRRWRLDDCGRIKKKAKETILRIYRELEKISDKKSRERLFNHAIRSEADQKIKAMLSMAESESGIPVTPDELDKDPWILNCQNGVLDLRTGVLNAHSKEDMITKICPVPYKEDTSCPKWLKFLNTVMDENQSLIDFLRRAVGYSLTGTTGEQCLFFLYGTGANGKTTFLEVILALLNDYARRSDFSTFLVKYNESIRNDIARLKGARFVSAIESSEGKRLAEGIVKQLTGQDMVTARFLRQEYFEYKPEFKIWLAANHKPAIIGSDYAIWRRIKVIPFTVTIPEKLQNPDLPAELKTELPGILRWAVEGCFEWQEVKLKEPKEVKSATETYKNDMDIIGDFLKDFCTILRDSRIAKSELYKKYAEWCEETGEKKMSKKKFGICLLERGFEDYRDMTTKYWLKIGLKEI